MTEVNRLLKLAFSLSATRKQSYTARRLRKRTLPRHRVLREFVLDFPLALNSSNLQRARDAEEALKKCALIR